MTNSYYIDRYKNAKHNSIYECYKKPSFTKEVAQEHIFYEMWKRGGEDYRILSHNTSFFTAGYTIPKTCDEDCDILVIHTPFRTIEIKL